MYAVTVEHRPPVAAGRFGDEPYAVALVDLEEGVRMMTNVVGVPARRRPRRHGGEVTWEPLSDGRHLALFQPAASGPQDGGSGSSR